MRFCDRLHQTRLKQDLTAQQMADYLGISVRAYRFYEAGSREPSLSMLTQIANMLGVTTDFLLGREPSKDVDVL